ncbi:MULTISPECIES: hypothetical protein [Bacillus]|uniref:hypothetical protein n=1 Tax=Bacillus TaxID=1386 RepID=UPI000772597F|nr:MULTISPECIES: hypothetical protein [Bacillus]KXH80311.1 hypothetical protein AU379_23780 [Bacillus sp. JH7]OJD97662.1 hypothetical protein A9487_26065 [Bacillus cereus]
MKKKQLVSALLTLGLAFGVGVSTLALPAIDASAEIGNEQPTITLGDGTSSSAEYEFNVPTGYGHVKCYFKNRGETEVKISLVHASSGKEYINKKLEPGGRLDWLSNETYSQGVRGGLYKLQLTSGDKPTKVDFAFKASNIKW